MLRVTGRGAAAAFAGEPGGHRWQRVPPGCKRGRVHTSTVTVAVLPEPTAQQLHIDPRDLDETFTRGTGKGGQHRNKTDTVVVLRHLPTGVVVRVDGGRSQSLNRETALGLLRARILATRTAAAIADRNAARRDQVGCGARGDKIRTIAVQRGSVTDHGTGKTLGLDRYLRGHLVELR